MVGRRSSSARVTGAAVRTLRIRLRPAWESFACSRLGPRGSFEEPLALATAPAGTAAARTTVQRILRAGEIGGLRGDRLDRPLHTSPASDNRIRTRYGHGGRRI